MRRAMFLLILCPFLACAADTPADADAIWKKLSPFFQPPPELATDFGTYKSPLKFDGGTTVKDAGGWQKRRQEILKTWHELLGAWPAVIDRPKMEYLEKEQRENFTQHHIKLEVAPNKFTEDAYLL